SQAADFSGPTTAEVGVMPAYSTTLNELQLTPFGALAPGYYRLLLNDNGNPLPPGSVDPATADYALSFQVQGSEGLPAPNAASGVIPADDTPATAHDLTFSAAGTARATGTIGDDPFYNPLGSDPNPGDDVDVYHFTVSGPGQYAFVADLWAGRVGSPLYG